MPRYAFDRLRMTHCRKIAVGGISSERVLTPSVSVVLPTASRRSHTQIIFYEKPKRESPTIGFRYPSAFPWGKGDHVVVDEGKPISQIKTGKCPNFTLSNIKFSSGRRDADPYKGSQKDVSRAADDRPYGSRKALSKFAISHGASRRRALQPPDKLPRYPSDH